MYLLGQASQIKPVPTVNVFRVRFKSEYVVQHLRFTDTEELRLRSLKSFAHCRTATSRRPDFGSSLFPYY